jgi:hypothetical protein
MLLAYIQAIWLCEHFGIGFNHSKYMPVFIASGIKNTYHFFDAWIEMIVAPMFRRFKIRSLGLIFETILTFKVGLEAFCDSSLSLFDKTLNLMDVKL